MGSDVYLSDNAGNRVPPGVASGDPVLGSGITINDATADGGDHVETVEAGATYQIMVDDTTDGAFLFGLATTVTPANILWFMPPLTVRVITIPAGHTSLHYQSLATDGSAYLVKMKP